MKSAWKMGSSLPTALSAGTSVLDAYQEARKLESIMLDTARRLGIRPKDAANREKMIGILADVPEKDVMRLIKDILKLFHALSNTKMLQTAVTFLHRCTEIMAKKSKLYRQSEIDGVELGCQMVQGGLDLFLQLEPSQFPSIIEGIEEIELEWYHEMKEEAAAGT